MPSGSVRAVNAIYTRTVVKQHTRAHHHHRLAFRRGSSMRVGRIRAPAALSADGDSATRANAIAVGTTWPPAVLRVSAGGAAGLLVAVLVSVVVVGVVDSLVVAVVVGVVVAVDVVADAVVSLVAAAVDDVVVVVVDVDVPTSLVDTTAGAAVVAATLVAVLASVLVVVPLALVAAAVVVDTGAALAIANSASLYAVSGRTVTRHITHFSNATGDACDSGTHANTCERSTSYSRHAAR
jgi:hypothetical protein